MQNEKTNNKVSAFCDLCDCQAKAERENLEGRGWYLGRNEQFCPECNS